MPKKEGKDNKCMYLETIPKEEDTYRFLVAQTSTQSSRGDSDDRSSTRSVVSRFPRVPSFNSGIFSRGRPVSPVLHIGSAGSESIPSTNGNRSTSNEKHCSTCQCWRQTTSTQANLDIPPPTPSTPTSPSSFRSVFPGVLLYVPEANEIHASRPSSSPSMSSLPYYRDM